MAAEFGENEIMKLKRILCGATKKKKLNNKIET